MTRWSLGSLFASLAVSVSMLLALSPAAHAGQAATQSSTKPTAGVAKSHGTFAVELVKALDSKKLKEGDAVEAKLTGGITLPSGSTVARGAKVIGHVTEAKARSKSNAESVLGIVFDQIIRPEGGGTKIKGVIQAVAPNPNVSTPPGTIRDLYGVDLAAATTASVATTLNAPSVPLLNEQSTGVLGISNQQLAPGGVLTSTGKEVKLDSGTRMLLNVTIQ